MRKYLGALAVAGICLAVYGCTGEDNGPNAYAGAYDGTFTSSNTSDNGTVSMQVDDSGNVTGTLVDNATSPATTENMDGTINGNGDISGDFTDSAGTSPYGGNLQFDNTGHLSGPINITTTSGVINAEFSLSLISSAKKYGTRLAVKQKAPPAGSRAFLK